MPNVESTPQDGSPWLSDAEIETDLFLAALGENLEDDLASFSPEYPDWDGGDPKSEDLILAYLSARTGRQYVNASRDNVYNHEQDFTRVFTYTIYTPPDTADWLFADDTYIAVCVHRGGDTRGNYDAPRLYRVDAPADTGFFDWVVGWTVQYTDHRATDGTAELDSDRFSVGYTSHPTSELDRAYGDRGQWTRGSFHFQNDDGTPTGISATPYAYMDTSV
jgi:hypothetical protein